ncbi:IS630 family transposase [Pseudomonas sp. TKO26]|uniref:IS630 family transposase n=1 Tax=unclassified Pseudomonas TaxID=196821 RepID=UPI000D97ABE0|nr:IS630 family transposase [Pseudomonas sp. TKO30]PYY93387.1 IS630 family transposase [Pseudomonas sp. TKO29]PYY95615.1 IS630 family transposase [Pseudomonas sp. TKO26]PYZ01547.1 IS630 family transposase [Pseudomonas sp. TKO14]
MSKPAASFVLTLADQATLQGWSRMGSLAQRLGMRAKILLLLADGLTPKEVSQQLRVSAPMVFKWRKRYLEAGLEGLNDLPRSGQPRKLSTQKTREILTLTTQRVPREAAHWSVRLMAKYAAVTTWQVRQVWAASDLEPHRLKTFNISQNPHFANRVVDIVGLYLSPPDNAIVLSVDKKSQIRPLSRTQTMRPPCPQLGRRSPDNKRRLYAVFDLLTGQVNDRPSQRYRSKELLVFLRHIERSTPATLDLHVVLDNGSIHKTPAIKHWLEKYPRFRLHVAPTSATWLNAAEGWISQLEKRVPCRTALTSLAELEAAIGQFVDTHDERSATPFQWHKMAGPTSRAVNHATPRDQKE